MRNSDQMNLGELITAFERIVTTTDINETTVYFGFGYFFPTKLDSWRGSYDELALNYTNADTGKALTVSDFLALLKSAVGKQFMGYKGGEYIMNEDTPVWVSNYGHACHTAVIGIIEDGRLVILETGYRDF